MNFQDLETLAQGLLDEMEKQASRSSAIEKLALMRAQEILDEMEEGQEKKASLDWDELNELATEVLAQRVDNTALARARAMGFVS